MSKFGLILAVIACIALPQDAVAQADAKIDVTGKWIFTVATDAGSGTPTVTLKQAGDSVTGHYSSQVFGEVDFRGSIKGKELKFSFATAGERPDSYCGRISHSTLMITQRPFHFAMCM